jgi:hypothetical protein
MARYVFYHWQHAASQQALANRPAAASDIFGSPTEGSRSDHLVPALYRNIQQGRAVYVDTDAAQLVRNYPVSQPCCK